jgi:predicted signal transduction protein with EAL and GGDEF domain
MASLRNTFDLPQGATHNSATIGIAIYPRHADTVDALMRFADTAMYVAKRSGKDRIQTWRENLPEFGPVPLAA